MQALKRRFGLIGSNVSFERALDIAVRVAPTNLSVLISGESGVGKEAIAHILHQLSPRKHNEFIAVNCGAIPEGTIDSELFGHEKGAFTGAVDSRKGYFEVVDGGTIFLDEIGEMPVSTQARLLRVLESGEYIRVGSSKVHKTDVRIVAATNKQLRKSIQYGKFREDLFYRLNTVPIEMPNLRDRQEDILKLFRRFVIDFSETYHTDPIKLTDEAKRLILGYAWPGNIRELKNFANQLSALATKVEITSEDIFQLLPKAESNRSNLPVPMDFKGAEEGMSDREILYKILFEMKGDIRELKRIIYYLVQQGAIPSDLLDRTSWVNDKSLQRNDEPSPMYQENEPSKVVQPIILSTFSKDTKIKDAEIQVESLSIADMEKDLIIKALKKYNGKRKYAAEDLGISERTLYRKIKEYNIEE